MALVLEDGAGVATANTYRLVSDLDTYAADLNVDTSAHATAAKEAALIVGTRFVDAFRFRGLRKTRAQALNWPRSGVVMDEPDDALIPDDEIPREVLQATDEAALKELTAGPLVPDVAAGTSALTRDMKQVGELKIEKEFREDGGSGLAASPVWRTVRDLLRPVLRAGQAIEVVKA